MPCSLIISTSSHQRKSRQRADGSGCASTHPRRKSPYKRPSARRQVDIQIVAVVLMLYHRLRACQIHRRHFSRLCLCQNGSSLSPKGRSVHPSVVIPDHAVICPVIHGPCLYRRPSAASRLRTPHGGGNPLSGAPRRQDAASMPSALSRSYVFMPLSCSHESS